MSGKRADENVISARQLTMQGQEALQNNSPATAEALFAQAIQLCPVDEHARAHYANSLWGSGKREEAILQMKEAVRLSGGDPELLVRLGRMHLQQGDLRSASVFAHRSIERNSKYAEAYLLRGEVYGQSHHHREALADYHQALALGAAESDTLLAIAEIYRAQGRPRRALATLDELAQRFPQGEEPLELLYLSGLAMKAVGRHHDSIHQLTTAHSRGLATPELHYHLAEAYLQINDRANAEVIWKAGEQQWPNHPALAALPFRNGSGQRLATKPATSSESVRSAGNRR